VNQLVASLRIPGFALEALLRVEPRLRAVPCALLDSASGNDPAASGKATIRETNRPAAEAGVHPGMTVVHARARCPQIHLLARAPEAEQSLARQLLDRTRNLAPKSESTAPGHLLLDLSTLPKARQAPDSWCRECLATLVPLGVPARLALAAHPDLARLATRWPPLCARLEFRGPDPHILPPPVPQPVGPDSLRPLPIDFLDVLFPPDSLQLLAQLGIRTLDEFLELPLHERNERFGPAARLLHRLLFHPDPQPLQHTQTTEKFQQAIDFEYPIQSSQVLLFHFKRMIETTASRLRSHHRQAVALVVELGFAAASGHHRMLRLPEPSLDVAVLLGPVRVHLESLRLPEPVTGAALEAEPGLPVESQPQFFDSPLPDPHRLSETLARLESMLGPEAVGIPVRIDTHRPDSFRIEPYDPRKRMASETTWPPHALRPPALPLRRFRPPPEVVVTTAPHARGTARLPIPAAVASGPRRGQIMRLRGPFLLSGAWWENATAWRQAEWDAELDSGHLLRLAFLPPTSWRLEGCYE